MPRHRPQQYQQQLWWAAMNVKAKLLTASHLIEFNTMPTNVSPILLNIYSNSILDTMRWPDPPTLSSPTIRSPTIRSCLPMRFA